MASQKVHFAVLEFDPSLAAPEKNFVFPLRSFNLSSSKDELVLDVDRSWSRFDKNKDDRISRQEFTDNYTIDRK